jgi:hypothetical protein
MNAHSCVHKGPPLVPVLSQMHEVYTFLPYFPKIKVKIKLFQSQTGHGGEEKNFQLLLGIRPQSSSL